MTARILAIGTAVPPTRVAQTSVRDVFAQQPNIDRLTARLVHAAFDAAAIEHRHTVLSELGGAAAAPGEARFLGDDGVLHMPTTGERNDLYIQTAPDLFAEAARDALTRAGVDADAVTHVVTVSCTGFFAPGPDYLLVRDLGFSPAVERYHLGFMGCAAGVPALRLAARITDSQPDAVVLVVCAELCSLHIRASSDPQQIVAASLFADGAGAAIVTANASHRTTTELRLDSFATLLTTEGEADMVWTIGDEGFDMTLTADVPRIVGREVRDAVTQFLADDPQNVSWAVHPGGRSVLDRVEHGLELPPDALATSRAVLRDYGNMSSATILFILQAIMEDNALTDGAPLAALAFGPGLTVESAMLTMHRA
ncbi:putative naringenin-chalcone synthase [Microbacterium endophyticum]|uniref:Putative naringenin-chalcone synthase n=1 Tax=Microbacterium endophyticum TaxID=1526412 RepID=A0A7W4YMU6_9MICO|nr:type III polyketide synthase [Microbacterium endophyticum]MBB2976840.1 putative naringenin-chalcone synthase [Microbacterium endophyticum]NIK35842.1 putative naringenin-chalcone synthase [Microbacterium endophyticum]